jgi:hypothetical protein
MYLGQRCGIGRRRSVVGRHRLEIWIGDGEIERIATAHAPADRSDAAGIDVLL